MTGTTASRLREHLIRDDGQEDLCMAIYRPSTGHTRNTAVVFEVLLPEPGERTVHGNVTFTGDYVLRAADAAVVAGGGLVILHSHPGARRWQFMSRPDEDAESSYANLVREVTALPLVGMTFAGADGCWSARHWDRGSGRDVGVTHSDNVRVIGSTLDVSWNDELVPRPSATGMATRTASCWGPTTQADLARRRTLVVGGGSVGLDVAVRLAATGLENIAVMDFDIVEEHNLDRLIGATRRDAVLRRSKTHVALREMSRNATAAHPNLVTLDLSICEPEGMAAALDYDLIFCCVDRPWPRAVLNGLAYSDLIPVIDGGIAIDTLPSGLMRNATWRSHVIAPGRPCLVCNRQLDPARVALDVQGLLDDPAYISGQQDGPRGGQNVSAVSINAAASLLAQFVSNNVGPAGLGDPGPLQYLLATHELLHLEHHTSPHCPYEAAESSADARTELTGVHETAARSRDASQASPGLRLKVLRALDDQVVRFGRWLDRRSV